MGEMLIRSPNTVKSKNADNSENRLAELVRHVSSHILPDGALRGAGAFYDESRYFI
jgi:hypothetical protein